MIWSDMNVRFYATLRDVVGARSAEVAVPKDSTVRDLLDSLFADYPNLKPRVLEESGQLRRAVNVFVNGRSVRFLSGLDTELSPEDDIAIFPPVAGGNR